MRKCLLVIVIISFSIFTRQVSEASDKLKVAASLYPLAHFASQVGGLHADVVNIMPPGAEPHGYEPTPRDIRKVWIAKVFIYNGGGLDPWAVRIHGELEKKGKSVVNISNHVDLSPTEKDETKRGKKIWYRYNGNRREGRFRNDVYDPHFWLDPLTAVKEVEIIREALIGADLENAETYRKNSAVYIKKLLALHEKYEAGLQSCKNREVIVTHDAFNYLAKRYRLHTYAIKGISPEEEPSARQMAELVKVAKKKNIKYIFFEVLASPKLAETIAREVGANTLVLNPLGGLTRDDIKAGKTYISIMEENLRNLRLAMSCK